MVLHLLRGLRLGKVLRDSAVDRFLRLLPSLERGQLRLSAELTRRKTLGELLGLRLVSKLPRSQCQLRVLRDSLIASLFGLHSCAKPRKFCLLTKLRPGQTLLECLLLRLISGGLRGKCLLDVLTEADVVKTRLLHASAKALQLRLVGEHRTGLLFGKALLTGRLIQTDALRCGLQ